MELSYFEEIMTIVLYRLISKLIANFLIQKIEENDWEFIIGNK